MNRIKEHLEYRKESAERRERRRRKKQKRAERRRQERKARLRSLPILWRPQRAVDTPNTLFSKEDLGRVRGHVQRLVFRDSFLRTRLSEERIGGIRDWEYGMLLAFLRNYPQRKNWRGLDVGSGNSTFPQYLVATGNLAHMTTLDLPGAYEKQSSRNAERDRRLGVERVEASMLDIPFPDASFDFVNCISAIEHLDGSPKAHKRDPAANPQLPYPEYAEATRTALREMARVLKPGGLMYVTTDAFVPELQETDAWSSPHGMGKIWSAYRFDDIENVFVRTVEEAGLVLAGQSRYGRDLLVDSARHGTYRGRYFTTFAIAASRPEEDLG